MSVFNMSLALLGVMLINYAMPKTVGEGWLFAASGVICIASASFSDWMNRS